MKFLSTSLEERRSIILSGNISKTLLFLSFPTLLMGIVQSLIPLSDGLFLNRTSGPLVVAAIGMGQPIINIINALSQGLAVASMAIIGQANGTGDTQTVKKLATQILVISFAIGILIAPTSIIFASIISKIVSNDLSYGVFLYLSLYSLIIPMLFMASIFNAIKNSTGQPEATFIRMIILLLLKILFNSIFLVIFKMGIIGAVMASLSSYVIIAIWMYYDLFLKHSSFKLDLKSFYFDKKILKQLLYLSLPTMLTYSLINLGFFLINLEVEKYGSLVLTAQTISSNINSICFTLPASIGTTVTTMISINIGAKNIERAKKSFKYGCILSVIISLIIIMIFLPTSKFMVELFQTKQATLEMANKEIMEIANHSLKIYTFSIIGFGIFMVSQGAFIGLGRTKFPLFMGILRVWLIRYLFILATKKWLGVDSVFWGNLISNYLAGFIFFYVTLKISWISKLKKL